MQDMSASTTPTVPSSFPETVAAMAHERCDRCGAAAFVMTVHSVGDDFTPLIWCAHHFAVANPLTSPRATGPSLLAFDIREVLTARESKAHA